MNLKYIFQRLIIVITICATKIMTNGWQLANMSNKLLEKVEALTLHLIELKKENDALRARVEKLEKK